jgi:hypothetical protein
VRAIDESEEGGEGEWKKRCPSRLSLCCTIEARKKMEPKDSTAKTTLDEKRTGDKGVGWVSLFERRGFFFPLFFLCQNRGMNLED